MYDDLRVEKYTRLQGLLALIKDKCCGGVAAELARKIERSDSYVNRLFYEPWKKGAKGIGPEIMDACSAKFSLPIGFWDMDPTDPALEQSTCEGLAVLRSATVRGEVSVVPPPALDEALAVVASFLDRADASTREVAAGMLASLAKNPANHGRVAIGLLAMLNNGGPQFETKDLVPSPAKR